ncbi:MAG TPA: hypothetical protein VLC48_10320 [Gemmatimonadota bacterium]|nr:hypothetical protein [Gemmatimonadota bacterium]
MKSFKAPLKTILLTHGFLALIAAVCVVGILYAEPAILYVVFLMFALWRWYQILNVPIQVNILDDGDLEFRGIVSRKRLRPDELTRVKKVARGIYIEWPEGTVNLYGNMEGASELLEYLVRANPGLTSS